MRIELSPSAYGQPGYGLLEARLVNMRTVETPGGPGRVARLPRAGLRSAYSVGVGGVVGLFQQAGVFDGDRFAVSGRELYREGELVDQVERGDSARFAASSEQVVVICGGHAYCYQLGEDPVGPVEAQPEFSEITIPDNQLVSDVFYIAGRFYFLILGSDRWYFSAINDAANIAGLAFATAESAPDANVAGVVVGDEAWFFGQNTVEPWAQTGNPDAPLQRAPGRTIKIGCAAQGSIVSIPNLGVIWLGQDRKVYLNGGTPVSSAGLETRLRRCSAIGNVTAFGCSIEGHAWYVINIPGEGSFGLDLDPKIGGWTEWRSYGLSDFRGRNAIMADGVTYVGDVGNGTIWQLDPDARDDDGDPIERIASAFVPSEGKPVRCSSISLISAVGVGAAGGPDPLVEMRYTDTLGKRWSDWAPASLGRIGEHGLVPTWWGLGLIMSPGRAFEFRCSQPVLSVFSHAELNGNLRR